MLLVSGGGGGGEGVGRGSSSGVNGLIVLRMFFG